MAVDPAVDDLPPVTQRTPAADFGYRPMVGDVEAQVRGTILAGSNDIYRPATTELSSFESGRRLGLRDDGGLKKVESNLKKIK